MYLAVSLIGAGIILFALLAAGSMSLRNRRALVGSSWLVWLACVLVWALSGVAYVLYLVSNDACLAIDWVLASPADSGLTNLVPCFDPVFSAAQLSAAMAPIYEAVESTNARLDYCNGAAGNAPPLGVGILCNPVNARNAAGLYTPGPPPSECDIFNVSLGHGNFNQAYNSQTCVYLASVGELPVLANISEAADTLYESLNTTENLLSCQFLIDVLDEVQAVCPIFTDAAQQLYAGMMAASIALVCLLGCLIVAYGYVGQLETSRKAKQPRVEHHDELERVAANGNQGGATQDEEAAKAA